MRRRQHVDPRMDWPFYVPGLTPLEACRALISASALTRPEIDVLSAAAAGEETVLDVDRKEAASMLAHWQGETPGLRLLQLRHWGTAIVRGGAPLDFEQREALALEYGNPFESDLGDDDADAEHDW